MLHYKSCNKLIRMDGVEGMKMLPTESIPMVVTSPPWDKMRHFGGHPFHFEAMAAQLWRVLMPGGVVCWRREGRSDPLIGNSPRRYQSP